MRVFSLFVALFMCAAPVFAQPARVAVSPSTLTLEAGATATLSAEAFDADDNAITIDALRWFAPDADIASVDENGVVTAHRPGTARVAVLVMGEAAFATVTVPALPPAALTLRLPTDAVYAGTSAPLHTTVTNRIGEVLAQVPVIFLSTNPRIATVDAGGRVYGHQPGETIVRAVAGSVMEEVTVRIVESPAVAYVIDPEGPLTAKTGEVIRFRVEGLTADNERVKGLMPGWAVGAVGATIEADGGEGVFVAEEPGSYIVTALVGTGEARTVLVLVEERVYDAEIVTVGRGPSTHHNSADTWVFEGVDGRDYAYIGTFWYDWMKAWDVTDPANPVLTDSVQVNARRINDVKIHPNNRLGIITREGASDRKNGIVLLDLSDPAHPTILSEYTETVTGGVHNVWIDGDRELVYAVHNGTSAIHILDIADPMAVKEVGRWALDKENRSLHDVIVQDGYLYASYWDDGLITLDVGAGTHGGTPTVPTFVSQYKYPIGNTHTAWRQGKYIFVGDEIFPNDWQSDRPIEARGYIHVLDATDLDNPVEVARYEVPEAGAHNVWVEDDKLYIGYYQGGLRIVDVSGELRGDLYEQGREIAHLKTTDDAAYVPNWPMTFSAQIHKGLIYSADFNSGLWITRLDQKTPLP